MQKVTDRTLIELTKRQKYLIPVVEIYPRTTEDIVSNSAPANAIGRFSYGCFTWVNSTGNYEYDAKILNFPKVGSYLADKVSSAEVTFSNVKRGEGSMSRFVLDNQIKGCWMVIRLITPDNPEDSIILFWGKCDRPGEITNTKLSISAKQDLGNFTQSIPFRAYQVSCPLEFARPLGGCLGDQTLAEKSVSYRQAVATYGSSGCNKTFTTCTLLDNTRYFQGQRTVAVSGQFSYVTIEEVTKRVLLFFSKKKKVQKVNTDSWSSVNQSEDNEVVPVVFGRAQLAGHPITWSDEGTQVMSLQGFCEGKIGAFEFVRSRTQGIDIVETIEHLGDWGGVGTQQLDSLFNGVGGYNSRLAYLEIVTNGSSPTQVDDAPLITAVIRGLEIPVPDPTGQYTLLDSSNNPVHIIRFLLTDIRFGRIPIERIDNESNLITADICDSIIEDRTNDEAIVLPSNEAVNYGITYRRFRSSGRYSVYRHIYETDPYDPRVIGAPPEFEEPEIDWFDPFQPYVAPRPQSVLRQKYTCNGAIKEKTTVLDFLNKQILPTFKGYINYGFNGKIQIKTMQKADNAYVRMPSSYLDNRIGISNISAWRDDYSGYLLIGVSTTNAEIRKVESFEYSTACNGLEVAVTTSGGLTATCSPTFTGGNSSSPASAYIDIDGTIVAGGEINIAIGTGDNQFVIQYIADGIETLTECRNMIVAFMNANLQFQEDLIAYSVAGDPNRIYLQCESGYLNLDQPMEFAHVQAEEVLRVQSVFENCNELTASPYARFDNFVADSFTWNADEEDEINAVVASYTSAIDDFHLTKILPRAAWDTIDLEGELAQYELDLSFVDNYWQAAYLAKSYAIEHIDGNLHFNFETGMSACRLELGDVIAVKHDSGDGVLNYLPVSIYSLETDIDNFKVTVGAKLYLSAAFDLRVQPVDSLLTTTLNPSLNPDIPPEPIGSNGGVGGGTEPRVTEPINSICDIGSFITCPKTQRTAVYSPNGRDIV